MPRSRRKPERTSNALIGAGGVHYIAAMLSVRGLVALPTVRNTKGFDLVVTPSNGRQFWTVQVKTSAKRPRFWPLGKMPARMASSTVYAFVRRAKDGANLEAFIVPGSVVKRTYYRDAKGRWDSWYLPDDDGAMYLNRWDFFQ